MKEYQTKQELVNAYTKEYHPEDSEDYIAKSVCKYNPSVYNGGWFIKDFGYSVERINMGINLVNNLI